MEESELQFHKKFMQIALDEAKKGLTEGGIPIGSVLITNDGKILGQGHNQRIQKSSPTLHAEIDCFENSGRLKADVYKNSILYSTLSPCDLCTGAVLLYGVPKVVIGENVNFKGPEDYSQSKGVKLINLDDTECKQMMAKFIKEKPNLWNEDIGV